MLDRAVLDRLAADVGRVSVSDMCRLFLDDLPGRVATMKAAFESGQATTVARSAHALASASQLLGATFLAGLCSEIEGRARAGHLDDPAAAAMGMVAVAVAQASAQLSGAVEPLTGE